MEPLARSLGATKGSFYWHFRGRDELLEAAMALWERRETDAVIAEVEVEATPVQRLERLVERVLSSTPARAGETALHAGNAEPIVSDALARVAARRIAYVQALLCEAGLPDAEADRRAHLVYAMVLGLDAFGTALPDRLPVGEQRPAWAASLVAMVLSGGP